MNQDSNQVQQALQGDRKEDHTMDIVGLIVTQHENYWERVIGMSFNKCLVLCMANETFKHYRLEVMDNNDNLLERYTYNTSIEAFTAFLAE